MSDSHEHGIHHGTAFEASATSLFTPMEVEEFQKSDRVAGGLVVALMAAIFTVGLLLYSIVLIAVAI
jgi:hypothetical protein